MDNNSYAKNNLEQLANDFTNGTNSSPRPPRPARPNGSVRPIRPVGSSLPNRPSGPTTPRDPNSPSDPDSPHAPSAQPPKSHKCFIACLSGLCGLLIGGVGVYALMALLPGSDAPTPAECDCPAEPAAALNNLDYDFLKLESSSQNLIYSPLSIKNGLALLDAGAAGTTKTELDGLLQNVETPQYEDIADQLSLANAVFVRDTFQDSVLPTYTATAQDDYHAEVIYDTFESSANMDNWVGQKTFGLINNIGLQPNLDTEMVLVNALAIQMDWQHPFQTDDTRGATFYSSTGEETEATTMVQTFQSPDVKYATTDDATLVTLPLASDSSAELEFVAIMPSGDLSTYIQNLGQSTIASTLDNLTSADSTPDGLKLFIPKFKFDYRLDFENDLAALGVKSAFTPQADFSNMATKELYLSGASHQANIDFSEKGIKAAAVTALTMDNKAMAGEEPQPVVIEINRPFLFLIRDRANGATWFTGTVYQPNLWADDVASYR